MSEGVIIALIGIGGLFLTAFFTFISLKATLKNNLDIIAANLRANSDNNAIDIQDRVDKYHKEVNGKMSELLDTTKALGKAEGKAEEKAKTE